MGAPSLKALCLVKGRRASLVSGAAARAFSIHDVDEAQLQHATSEGYDALIIDGQGVSTLSLSDLVDNFLQEKKAVIVFDLNSELRNKIFNRINFSVDGNADHTLVYWHAAKEHWQLVECHQNHSNDTTAWLSPIIENTCIAYSNSKVLSPGQISPLVAAMTTATVSPPGGWGTLNPLSISYSYNKHHNYTVQAADEPYCKFLSTTPLPGFGNLTIADAIGYSGNTCTLNYQMSCTVTACLARNNNQPNKWLPWVIVSSSFSPSTSPTMFSNITVPSGNWSTGSAMEAYPGATAYYGFIAQAATTVKVSTQTTAGTNNYLTPMQALSFPQTNSTQVVTIASTTGNDSSITAGSSISKSYSYSFGGNLGVMGAALMGGLSASGGQSTGTTQSTGASTQLSTSYSVSSESQWYDLQTIQKGVRRLLSAFIPMFNFRKYRKFGVTTQSLKRRA